MSQIYRIIILLCSSITYFPTSLLAVFNQWSIRFAKKEHMTEQLWKTIISHGWEAGRGQKCLGDMSVCIWSTTFKPIFTGTSRSLSSYFLIKGKYIAVIVCLFFLIEIETDAITILTVVNLLETLLQIMGLVILSLENSASSLLS